MNQGWAIWLTGLPASGKSTVARLTQESLRKLGINVQILESDTIRKVLTPNPTYSPEEREIFYSSLVYIGGLLSDNGVNVIFDATGNREKWRYAARKRFGKFMEVYLKCPLEVCRQRDPKGIYGLVNKGEAKFVPGVQQEYEEPNSPDVTLDCLKNPSELTEQLIKEMKNHGLI